MGSNVEAKSICIRKMEDMISDPVYTVFHVQRKQIANRTETDNATLFHFKNSMGKVKEWNSSTVRDFCSSLPMRFPVLEGFGQLFNELQNIICRILNESSESNVYSITTAETYEYLHSILSACSEVFISCPQLFAVGEDSTEFTTCKTNARTKISQMNVVENTIMTFVKSSPKPMVENSENIPTGEVSDESPQEDVSSGSEEESGEESDIDDTVRVIDIANGGFEEKTSIGEFSTPGEALDEHLGEPVGEPTGSKESGDDSDEDERSDKGSGDEESDDEKKTVKTTKSKKGKKSGYASDDASSEESSDSSDSGSDDSDASSVSLSDFDFDTDESDSGSSDSSDSGSDSSDSGSDSSDSDDSDTVKISSKVLKQLLKIKKESKARKMRKRSV